MCIHISFGIAPRRIMRRNSIDRNSASFTVGSSAATCQTSTSRARAWRNKQLDEKFTQTALGALKDDLAKLQHETKLKDETILHLRRQVAGVQNNIQEIFEALARRPSADEVAAALERKRFRPVSVQAN